MIKVGTLVLIIRTKRYPELLGRVGQVIAGLAVRETADGDEYEGYAVSIPGRPRPHHIAPYALRPISDPDADVREWAGDKHPEPVAA